MRILLLGYGKMGRLIEQVGVERGHCIAAIIDQPSHWNTVAIEEVDVAIDFSTPLSAIDNMRQCFDRSIPLVIGTTGWQNELEEMKQLCAKKDGALFYASNFSLGMNVVFRLNRALARMLNKAGYQFRMKELHHIHKLDAPSGTALQLADDIISEIEALKSWSLDNTTDDQTLPIHVTREGEVPGTHEIIADSEVDAIILRHEAKGRRGFAMGAVMAAEFLQAKKGIYTMDDLLDINA
jgi:4-hydroxy-tetrahydrodipicolinate reductase